MPRKNKSYTICPNCGHQVKDSNYCPDCGQPNKNKNISLKQFLIDFVGDYFTFDSKLFRSFFPLVSRPGHLTNEYIQGKRVHYILPLRLYIFTTFFFFLIITASSKIDEFSFDNIKPADTWAVQDSMVNFLSQTQPDLPAQKIKEIADNLDNNFEFIYRTSKNDSFFTDTLKALLADEKYNLDDNLKDKLARNLDINFVFTKMSKESNQMSISRMCEVIDGCSTSIDSVLRDSIIAHIDNIYFFKSAEKKSSAGRIIIFGKEDSLDSGFEKYLQAKIKKIVSRGEEGELLFLAEMLNQAPKVMFLLLPVFALLLKLFYIRRRIFYINHLVFALHLHTLLFIYLLIPILFTYWYVVLLFFIVIAANTYIAFLKVYKQGRIKTFFKMNLIMLIYTFIISLSASLLVFLAIFNI